MSKMTPFDRGYGSASSRIDADGCKSAHDWLKTRQADKSKEPLHPGYISGYKVMLNKLCQTGLGRPRRRRRR